MMVPIGSVTRMHTQTLAASPPSPLSSPAAPSSPPSNGPGAAVRWLPQLA